MAIVITIVATQGISLTQPVEIIGANLKPKITRNTTKISYWQQRGQFLAVKRKNLTACCVSQ